MLESLAEGLAAHRGAPDKEPARRLATLEAAGELAIPFTTGHPGRHRRRPRRTSWPRCGPSPRSHARHGHVQEVIVQNFLPKPGTAMAKADALPARGPAVGHRGGPPGAAARRSTCRRRPTSPTSWPRCSHAGIDDWGGVSPVTADHVNPERAWPALDVLRAATEAAGHTLAPRLTVYPDLRPRPRALARPGAALRRARRVRRRGAGPRRDVVLGGRGAAAHRCSTPTAQPPESRTAGGGAVAEVLAGVALGQEVGEAEIVTLFGARGPEVRMVAEVADDLRRQHRRRRRHLRAQPQHQLHERLHVQVPLLRLLEGAALAQPARRALPARARRDHAARGRGRRARAPPRSACRAASTPTSTATTTCTCSRPCGRARPTSTSTASPRWR